MEEVILSILDKLVEKWNPQYEHADLQKGIWKYMPAMEVCKSTTLMMTFLFSFAICFSQIKVEIKNKKLLPMEVISLIPKEITNFNNLIFQKKVKQSLYSLGYLFPEIHLDQPKNDSIFIEIIPNEKLLYGKISKVVEEENKMEFPANFWLQKSGIGQSSLEGKTLSGKEIPNLTNLILTELENNGYPFAEIHLTPIEYHQKGNKVDFQINIKRNQLVVWDTILISGDTTVEPSFISTYLQIKKGKPFSEKTARSIEKRLKELLYIQVIKSPIISITFDQAVVKLQLKSKQANRINGVLGLAPSSTVENKLLLTGEADIDFLNLFGRGIQLNVGYKSFLAGSSQVKINTAYPFIFNSLYGVGVNFSYYRVDTAYYILDYGIKLQYQLSPIDALKITYAENTSRLIDVGSYKNSTRKPPYLDVSTKWYGIGFQRIKLDFLFNPRKGLYSKLDAQVGTKNIIKNVNLPESNYTGLILNSLIYRLQGEGGRFTPLNKLFVLNIGAKFGFFYDKSALENQLFRFGGLRTLRGFDEEQFFATFFIIPNFEIRLLTGEGSHLQAFINGCYYERKQINVSRKDSPIGFGLAYNYLTNLGMFNISFAVGKEQNNPLDFTRTKLHIGYLSRF